MREWTRGEEEEDKEEEGLFTAKGGWSRQT
jgi:hypothetical protein